MTGFTDPLELVPDENVQDVRAQRNFVGRGGMVCAPCNIALVAPQTGYIQSEYCPQCGGSLKLRSQL